MDQSILNALELFDSNAPRVVIMQKAESDTGGPEALLQLALAFHSWMPTRTFMFHPSGKSGRSVPHWYQRGYPNLAEVQSIGSLEEIRKGDIYIIPEIIPCPTHLVERGVNVHIFQLSKAGTTTRHSPENFKQIGCKFISHTCFLSSIDGLNPSRSHITIPYLRQAKTHYGPINNEKREDIILMNSVHRGSANYQQHLDNFCSAREKKCEVIAVRGFTTEQLIELYHKAKIIVADTLNGAERSVLEAVLTGAIALTNDQAHGSDSRDFPIPFEHKYSEHNPIEDVVERMLSNFEEEQAKQENLRSLYKNYDGQSLAKDTKRFMHDLDTEFWPNSSTSTIFTSFVGTTLS